MSRSSFPRRPGGGVVRDLDQPGYYPGYSTLAQKKSWDAATRQTVVERVGKTPPPLRFFSAAEAAVMEAVIARVLPQDDRSEARTIPILPVIDARLHSNALNGFRYEEMPCDQEAYRLAIRAIDEMAQSRHRQPFAALGVHQQELILKSLHDGKPDPDNAIWDRMPVRRLWALLMEDCVTAYYSHPWAWDEIGFGGPAYPRGYMRLEHGLPEPWEKEERRYAWRAPADSASEIEEERSGPARDEGERH